MADREATPQAVIASDGSSAELVIPSDVVPDTITPEMALGVLRKAEVTVSDDVIARVTKLVEEFKSGDGNEARSVVAKARKPKHGTDGHIEWYIDQDTKPNDNADKANSDTEEDDDTPVSFYDHCAFVMVHQGDKIGRVFPPTLGEDGQDVKGKVLVAKAGKAPKLNIDESITKNQDGTLIAQEDGLLTRSGDRASIKQSLEIPEYVDFSTGNLDFEGDITIRKGVRDLFTVNATGSIEVSGLVEAAELSAGADVFARGGMAGRETGTIDAGSSVHAKYLDSVTVNASRNLLITKETVNCDITVHNEVLSPTATIIGGKMVVTGKAEVGTIGREMGTKTEIVLGTVPLVQASFNQLSSILSDLEARRNDINETKEMLENAGAAKASIEDMERMMELQLEVQVLDDKIKKAQQMRDRIADKIKQVRTVDLTITRMLHNGAVIHVGNIPYTIKDNIRGPIAIYEDRSGRAMYKRGDNPGAPLALISENKMAA